AGVAPEKLVRIQHPVFESGVEATPPSGRTILFFGLIREYKGLDVLLRALAEVPDARLVVAGDPLDPVEPLQRLAAGIGVADRIEWRLGFLPDEDIPPLMAEATLVALPYRRIDSSGVLATALGHGRPAVVTDVGGLPDAIREFGAGRVVAAGDPKAFAAALRELLEEHELANAFAGAQRARRALTWDAAAAEHEAVYREVAA
ncbi:MAG TPA: glycosyltransferase, partial [Gaiellaceae bacterium]|nr:glycosyltransferase [Gaiellaceae bacterium]